MTAYKYHWGNTLTGDIQGDIPFSNVEMTWVLSGAGTFSGEITTQDPEAYARGAASLLPGRTSIYVERDGDLIWAGIVWTMTYDESGIVKIGAKDYWSYFARRLYLDQRLIPDDQEGAVLTTLLDSILLNAFVDSYGGGSATVPQNLDYDLSQVGTQPTDFTSFGEEDAKSVAEVIEALAAQDPGIDFRVRPYWNAPGEPRIMLELGAPSLGKDATATSAGFTFPGSIVTYSVDINADRLAQRLFVSASEASDFAGDTALIDTWTVGALEPRYDGTAVLDAGATGAGGIASAAAHLFAQRGTWERVYSLTVRADQEPIFERYLVGDDITMLITDPKRPIAAESSARLRIGELKLIPATEIAEITPWSPNGDS